MSPDYADETLRTVTLWGRYAEIFAHDEDSDQFSLRGPRRDRPHRRGDRHRRMAAGWSGDCASNVIPMVVGAGNRSRSGEKLHQIDNPIARILPIRSSVASALSSKLSAAGAIEMSSAMNMGLGDAVVCDLP